MTPRDNTPEAAREGGLSAVPTNVVSLADERARRRPAKASTLASQLRESASVLRVLVAELSAPLDDDGAA